MPELIQSSGSYSSSHWFISSLSHQHETYSVKKTCKIKTHFFSSPSASNTSSLLRIYKSAALNSLSPYIQSFTHPSSLQPPRCVLRGNVEMFFRFAFVPSLSRVERGGSKNTSLPFACGGGALTGPCLSDLGCVLVFSPVENPATEKDSCGSSCGLASTPTQHRNGQNVKEN